jgi:hypothetical protein
VARRGSDRQAAQVGNHRISRPVADDRRCGGPTPLPRTS